MKKATSKAGYLSASIASIVLLFSHYYIQSYFSYKMATTYTIHWMYLGLLAEILLAAACGLSLCWSRELSRNFRIPAEAVKAALALAALGMEIFYYRAPSTVAVFCAALFLTGFFANLTGRRL